MGKINELIFTFTRAAWENLKIPDWKGVAPKAAVKSLDFRQGSDIFRFLLEKDHVCCCLEKGLRGSRQWQQSELRVTEEAGWMRKGRVQ